MFHLSPSLPAKVIPAGHNHRRSRGAALVVVSFALVLISVLILAFFSQTMLNRKISFSSASQARADMLALGALGLIEGDLVSEMQQGSTVLSDSSNTPIFSPLAGTNMIPYRMTANLSDTPHDPKIPFNLVKWSSGTYPLWPATGYNGAGSVRSTSGFSSSKSSQNGRYIDTSRWTKPGFTTSTTIPSSIVPDWVLMTRQGTLANPSTALSQIKTLSNPVSTNADYVIGRYAFMVYDVGGLLDINAAGYPSSAVFADIARKGNQGYADLSQLGLSTAQITQLISWRNAATSVTMPAYANYLSDTAAEFGFLHPADGDNAFLSRQDLLQFGSNILSPSTPSLNPYFTTFSREKNAPSWGPVKNASEQNGQDSSTDPSTGNAISYAYRTNRDQASAVNRFLPNVRVRTAFSRLSYVSGSTTDHQQAVVGEPLVKNRFDLRKLSWITYNNTPPSGVSATDIYNYFGLNRNVDGSWTYNHSSLTPLPSPVAQTSQIMTLDQVGQAGREPDFFELLQAAILQGSLGLCSGDPSTPAATTGAEFYRLAKGAAANVQYAPIVRSDTDSRLVYAQEKYQILQIGANLIDQYDADNFPTDIALNGEHIYGTENLPYLNAVADTVLRPSSGGIVSPNASKFATAYQAYVHRWFTISLWNPHQNAPYAPATGPANIRISLTNGQENPRLQNLPYGIAPVPGTTYQGRQFLAPGNGITNTPAYMIGPAWIGIKLSDYSNHFAEPTPIDYDKSYTSDASNPASSNMNDAYAKVATSLGWKRAGIYMGWSYSPDNPCKVPACTPLYPNYKTSSVGVPPILYDAAVMDWTAPLTAELQYEDPNSPGTWHTYQILRGLVHSRDARGDSYMEPSDPAWSQWDNTVPTLYGTGTVKSIMGGNFTLSTDTQEGWAHTLLDPRSVRFNVQALRESAKDVRDLSRNMYNITSFSTGTIQGPHFTSPGSMSTWINNTPTATSRYSDRDNVVRPGDAAGWNNASPLPSTTTSGSVSQSRRPLHLNRPFRSVAEIGYAFRGEPWKTLNLTSSLSADAGLLDIFYIGSDSPTTPNQPAPDVVAGKININSAVKDAAVQQNAASPVLQALISQALRDYSLTDPTTVNTGITSSSDIQALATDLVTAIKAAPLVNLSDLPAVFPQDVTVNSKYPGVKAQREALIRALSDSSQVRTWNLLIDIIAQAGKFSNGATSLDQFVVEGEKHYWLHVAIDRFTGEIVDKQLEPVSE